VAELLSAQNVVADDVIITSIDEVWVDDERRAEYEEEVRRTGWFSMRRALKIVVRFTIRVKDTAVATDTVDQLDIGKNENAMNDLASTFSEKAAEKGVIVAVTAYMVELPTYMTTVVAAPPPPITLDLWMKWIFGAIAILGCIIVAPLWLFLLHPQGMWPPLYKALFEEEDTGPAEPRNEHFMQQLRTMSDVGLRQIVDVVVRAKQAHSLTHTLTHSLMRHRSLACQPKVSDC